jgi:inorganic phosphate transporter, PiT family
MILLFLTSGLFLGWSLGANDASNVFGSAVGSKMISFRRAAVIASLFVILGAVIQGAGTSDTLGKLGAVNTLGGSFTVALAAAITIYVMTKFGLPVSTTQSIVGAIIGWNLFTGNPTDSGSLTQIVITWISGPILGSIFAVVLYILLRSLKRRSKVHLVRFESIMKYGLILAGAFGAYSLGANNIANVMGVFIPAFNLDPIDTGFIVLNSNQQLFLLGGFAIAAGIITYSKKVMDTVGSNILELSSEAALVVVLAQSLVLFIFSSSGLSALFVRIGLPAIPMVPVSSSQVIVGCILGIGIYKGARNINFKMLGEIGIGWITSPVASGLLAFLSLFLMKNVFGLDVGSRTSSQTAHAYTSLSGLDVSEVFRYSLLGIVVIGILVLIIYFLYDRKKKMDFRKSEEKFWMNLK